MKTIILILSALLPAVWTSAQDHHLPDVDLRDINGKIVSGSTIADPNQATLLVFWRPSSKKFCDNLENLYDAWKENLQAQGVKLVAISIDCNGSWTHIKPLVEGNDWEFEAYIDINGEFKRAMSIGDAPSSMLFDKNQNLVHWYNTAFTGSREYICQHIMDHLNSGVTASNFRGIR